MLSPAHVFRLLNELVFVLLGVLLAGVAFTGRYSFNRRAPAWLGLGAFLIYWGLRAWWREGRPTERRAGFAPARSCAARPWHWWAR